MERPAYAVLYVGDERSLLDAAKKYLELEGGFRVDTAISAAEGLAALSRGSYDAIISDYDMPGMNGIEFLKKIRAGYGDIPLILFAGRGHEAVAIDAVNHGADFFLMKTGNPHAEFAGLIRVVERLVGIRKKLEESERRLIDSEELYRSLTRTIPDPVYVVNMEGMIEYANPVAGTLFHAEPESLVGKTLHQVFPSGIADRHLDAIRNVIRSGRPSHSETADYSGNGMGSIDAWLAPVRTASGEIRGVIGISRDITGRMEEERKIRENEERYRILAEAAHDLIYIIDLEDRVAYVNSFAAGMLGISKEDAIGRPRSELFPPEVSERQRKSIRKVIDSGIPLRIESETPIGNHRTWQDTMLVPLRDQNGTVTGVMGISRDVTALKKAIEDERRLERRFVELADLLPEIVFETDPGGKVRFANRLGFETFGITPTDIEAGCTIFDFIALKERETAIRKFQGIVAGEWSEGNEYTLVRKDGSQFPAYVSVCVGRNGQGTPDMVWGVIIDLTESKRAEHALRQANRQLTLLNSITRHDILNKVTVLLGYLALAKEDETGNKELLEKLESTTYAIRTQIEFSRVYQNLGTTEPQWQKLDEVLPVSQTPPQVTLQASPNGVEIFADPMIERVFYNLLDNALKHGGGVTVIRIFSMVGPEGLILVWQDNGVGIPPDEKERIFERGYGKNNGLGLFLVREILAITGIAIRECGNEGEGARFEISVPNGAFRIRGCE